MQRFEKRDTRSKMRASRFDRTMRAAIVMAATAAMLVLAGCRQDMQDEPKFFPQRGTTFYPDGRSVRPQVEGTVARSQGDEDSYFYTGLINGKEGDGLPIDLTADTMARGQERFNIYCTPCHSRVGNGLGEIVERGYKPAANLHDQVRLSQPISHYFYVMTHGYGAMPDYREQLTPEDRWAVAAYIRALQLSQAATQADVPAGTQVKSLGEVATEQSLPANYAQPWTLPATAIQAYPPVTKEGTPAMAPANPADPAVNIPQTKTAAPGAAAK